MHDVSAIQCAPLSIAVTGASGFVGSHVTRTLASSNAFVRALVRAPGRVPAHAGVSIHIVGAYTDAGTLQSVFSGCDAVVHLAARAHRLNDDPTTAEAAFEAANVDAARAVALAARGAEVRRLVLVSSIGVLGERTCGTPFSDASQPAPAEPYAISKLRGERAVADALAGGATEWVVLRPPLVYGPHAPGNFGLLMRLVRNAPIVPFAGLRRRRSLISVANLCDAIAVAATHPATANRHFVVADNEPVSVAEIAQALAEGFGRTPRCLVNLPESWLRAAGSIAGRRAAVDKLADELMIDASGFRAATGWRAPLRAIEALRAAAVEEAATATSCHA